MWARSMLATALLCLSAPALAASQVVVLMNESDAESSNADVMDLLISTSNDGSVFLNGCGFSGLYPVHTVTLYDNQKGTTERIVSVVVISDNKLQRGTRLDTQPAVASNCQNGDLLMRRYPSNIIE